MDFVKVGVGTSKKGTSVYPIFQIVDYHDLMVRGGDFYAFWDEQTNKWSFDEKLLARRVDDMLYEKAEELRANGDETVTVLGLSNYDSNKWSAWRGYVKSQPDNFHTMDDKLLFADHELKRDDYATHKLGYSPEDKPTPAYDELMSTLYDPDERDKLEWAIGSIFAGDSPRIQKFVVLYGEAGSGKSTVLNIIQMLFDGYYESFESKALGNSQSSFALAAFESNPLVGIEHDGDLSRIEDNTRLNSLISHEEMIVNQKYKAPYSMRINAFLFVGSNKPVRISDAKSGIMRRLIYVQPSNRRMPFDKYTNLMSQIGFELGGIAHKCLWKYHEMGISYYDNYRPLEMMGYTNDFYNFMQDQYPTYDESDATSLASAWTAYKQYCDDANVHYPYSKRIFKMELGNYFEHFIPETRIKGSSGEDIHVRNYFTGFRRGLFSRMKPVREKAEVGDWLELKDGYSPLDEELKACPAQYAKQDGTPTRKWESVRTTLEALDTSRLHYVKVPENHIVIDFDLKNIDGEKDLDINKKAAMAFPKTYAEVSRSGKALHLHYVYDGDVSKLSNVYDDNIEIKVYTGNSALRRQLTLHNGLAVTHISSGLPLRKEEKMINFDGLKNEKALRTLVLNNLAKKYHPGTKPSVEFIRKALDDAYASGMSYDLSDLRPDIMSFALNSTHHASYCAQVVSEMKFQSEDASDYVSYEDKPIVFYDVEVFPNLFVIVWKQDGGQPVQMINPTPEEVEELCKMKLVGFNNRRYDNHILYARLMGYTNEQLYTLSSRIVEGSPNASFIDAYNLSYADVYDFSSKKQSLKKFEIELGIHHQELGLPWDQPVDKSLWGKVADYCINDVVATEATFHARHEDFVAREILASLSGLSVNHTNRQHTERILFGMDRHPQDKFIYTELATGKMSNGEVSDIRFDGYEYVNGKSMYRGEDVGNGGYVYSEPGYYENVALLDIASMHPTSIIELNLFGDTYTKNFKELLDARIDIKHGDYESAAKRLGGKLKPFLTDPAEAKKLSAALKIPINSVYGLTAAKFENKFRDNRNKDNIVAKRGALFMVNLKHEVQSRGYTVAHIKTDSIKIPNADKDIIDFVMDYGRQYGYTFEHEATYAKMCLVNDAVYIAKQADDSNEDPGEWTATGTQFQVPYVFKTLFTHDPITFEDLCETKTVSGTGVLYLDMNEMLPDVSKEETLKDIYVKSRSEKKKDKLLKREIKLLEEFEAAGGTEADLDKIIAEGHNYIFVGRAGAFCPVKVGSGGGLLLRESEGKYSAAAGTKGYRWMEAEVVKNTNKESLIDKSYFTSLVDAAVDEISKYCDVHQFVQD